MDGDGYGDATSVALGCDTPADHVADDQDCDDGDGGVSPAETEVCDNGTDENCDGGTSGCRLGASFDLLSADAIYAGATEGELAGTAVTAIPGLDGTSGTRLVFGAYGAGLLALFLFSVRTA